MIYKKQKTKNISFPIGGIGTGCIGLSGNGALVDWEFFNRPNKNTYNGCSHFAIKVNYDGKSVTKVLHGDTNENLLGMHDEIPQFIGFGYGPHSNSMAGYPHFKDVKFEGKFPIANVTFSEEEFPVLVKLTAFNPLIPHDEYHSSLPTAFFEWNVENLTEQEIECAIAFSLQNPAEKSYNRELTEDGFQGIFFQNKGAAEHEVGYYDLCVLTDCPDAVAQAFWYRGGWQDSCTTYWKNLSADHRMRSRHYEEIGKRDHGSLVGYFKLQPKGIEKLRFVLAWNAPNQCNYWRPRKDENGNDVTWKNYYATQFTNSKASAKYAMQNFNQLFQKTQLFSDTLQNSSVPDFVIDAISANLSVLKSPTVLRLQDGSFWAWEGNNERVGSCEGSCQHVWNYAYALPFLFPRLERSLRENTMKYALNENGSTEFRVPLPLGYKEGAFRPCVDGQMGEVIKCYREWKISGDDAWIKQHSSDIFKMLDFAWSEENKDKWDFNKDGILEGRQHHTLDMELFGPSSWLQGFYLLALDCAARIADFVGDTKRAECYRALYENGRQWTNENLFNGEYFCQKIDLAQKALVDQFDASNYWNEEEREIKYQIADGCMIDQMLADWHAEIIGIPTVFDEKKKQRALQSLYYYNYKPSMRDVTNMWRVFAVNDEGGTVICSYPQNVKVPAIPVPYGDECMTGFEYALAGLMIANGFIKEGETMVKAIRARYDGEKRNPWNEIECGSNYARSMASYALLPIYSGFQFDMTKKQIGFVPAKNKTGQYLWSVGNTWGSVRLTVRSHLISVFGEKLVLQSYLIGKNHCVRSVKVDGKKIPYKTAHDQIIFDVPIEIEKVLEIEL